MDVIWIVCGFLLGLIIGSFANVVIYRLPRGRSVVWPSSACFHCARRLAAWELVPVFSWLVLRGRCRSCGEPISGRYIFVELLCGVLFAAMVLHTPTLSAVPLMSFAFVLLTVSFIDWDTQEIPDGLLLVGGVAGLVWVAVGWLSPHLRPYSPCWRDALLGVLAGALPLLIVDRLVIILLKKDGFGYGDVKLMAMVGLFLGWQLTLMAFFFAFVSGGAYATYLICTKRAQRGDYLAFGPFLCFGSVVSLWFGWDFIRWIF